MTKEVARTRSTGAPVEENERIASYEMNRFPHVLRGCLESVALGVGVEPIARKCRTELDAG